MPAIFNTPPETQVSSNKYSNSILGVYNHASTKQVVKNQILLPHHLINFLEKGEKVVYYANKTTTITHAQFVILTAGNCLMTEKLSVDNDYRSTLFYFANTALTSFFIKYAPLINQISPQAEKLKEPFLVFEKDGFISNYIVSLKIIQQKPLSISGPMLALKFEELMLHLLEKYPPAILSFQTSKPAEYSDFEIKKAVEQNITSNLTLDELAFLCHTSVATFKRKFIKLYHAAPRQYFLQRKMEIATALLLQNENPSRVFYQAGYENHSSFSQAFKQVYGVSPKQFQQQRMLVSQQHLSD